MERYGVREVNLHDVHFSPNNATIRFKVGTWRLVTSMSECGRAHVSLAWLLAATCLIVFMFPSQCPSIVPSHSFYLILHDPASGRTCLSYHLFPGTVAVRHRWKVQATNAQVRNMQHTREKSTMGRMRECMGGCMCAWMDGWMDGCMGKTYNSCACRIFLCPDRC